MGQRVIPVAVTAEYIGGDGVTLGAAGSHNSVLIEYDFRSAGPQWDDISGRYVLWTNPQGNNTNRINLGVAEKVEGYEGVYQAAPPADAMCVPGWAEMVVVGFTMDGDKEVTKIKTEPSRFRVLPGSSRGAADNEGIAPTVADQLQAEIEAVGDRKVNKPAGSYDKDGAPGQVLESLGDGSTRWRDETVATKEVVDEVLREHPDWVTTVEDGAISAQKLADGAVSTGKIADGAVSKDKLSDALRNEQITGNFVDRLWFPQKGFMNFDDAGYGALGGLCCFEDRYLCVVRWHTDGTKRLQVYDYKAKEFLFESSFTNDQVKHANSIAYKNGAFYVARDEATEPTDFAVVRIAVDIDNRQMIYDGEVYDGTIPFTSIACDGVYFYLLARINGSNVIYKTEDFGTLEMAFETDLNGRTLVAQGMDCDDQCIYITYSDPGVSGEPSALNNESVVEKIYAIGKDNGYIYKCFEFARGSYGEIEDAAVVDYSGSKYVLVALNRNTRGVTKVLAAPLEKGTTPIAGFDAPLFEGGPHNMNEYAIYVDNVNGTAFGTGLQTNPYKGFNAALDFVRKVRIPAHIYVSGNFDTVTIHSVSSILQVTFTSASSVGEIVVNSCAKLRVNVNSSATQPKHISVSDSVCTFNAGTIAAAEGQDFNLEIYRSFFAGYFNELSGAANAVKSMLSVATIFATTLTSTTNIHCVVTQPSIVNINNVLYGPSGGGS